MLVAFLVEWRLWGCEWGTIFPPLLAEEDQVALTGSTQFGDTLHRSSDSEV